MYTKEDFKKIGASFHVGQKVKAAYSGRRDTEMVEAEIVHIAERHITTRFAKMGYSESHLMIDVIAGAIVPA